MDNANTKTRVGWAVLAAFCVAGLVTALALYRSANSSTPAAGDAPPIAQAATSRPAEPRWSDDPVVPIVPTAPTPIPTVRNEQGIYANIVPQRLVPLKDNVSWDVDCPRWPVRNVPRNPLDIVASSSRPEPELVKWIERWQQVTWSGQSVTAGDREKLSELLEPSGLASLALLEAGQSFDLAGDEATAALWFRHGVARGEKELADVPAKDLRGRRLAEMLIVVQGLMWPAQNSALINEGPAFERLYRMLVATLPDDDEQYAWSLIGIGDGLLAGKRNLDALRYLESLSAKDVSRMVPKQTAAVSFGKAVGLLGLNRYREAIPFLQESLDCHEFQHQREASALLVITYARCGERASADRLLARHMSDFAINEADGRSLAAVVAAVSPASFEDIFPQREGETR